MTTEILQLLVIERDKLTEAIEVLSGLKRRGRPPKNPSASFAAATAAAAPVSATPKKKRTFTAAQRAAMAERMRQRWAAKRRAEARTTKKSLLPHAGSQRRAHARA